MFHARLRRLLRPLALAAAALALTGCTVTGSSSQNNADDSARIVGISMPYLTNQFMGALNEQLVSTFEDEGWQVLATTDAGAQAGQQVQDVRNLIAAGATALVIDPYDSAAIVAALNAAEEAGVPVVLVDVGASGGTPYMTVRADNYRAGVMVCKQMGKRLEERYGEARGTVLQLQGALSSVAGQERTNGFEECMAQKFPAVEILSKPTEWQGPKAADATQTVVNSRDIDGIYLQSDCGMLAPVQSVLSQAGESTAVNDPDRIIVGGIDGCPATLEAIHAGEIDFTVEQPLNDYGQRAAHFLDAARAGKEFTVGKDGFGGKIVENENGQLENLLPATLVTIDNADSPSLWGNQG